MLNFFPEGMVERYLLFSFLAVLGVLQLVAAHYRLVGFSLPGRQRWRWGYPIGAGLLAGAYFWFFGRVQHLIFVPGLAGTELFTVFSVSTLLALATTLGLTSLLHRSPEPASSAGKRIDLNPGRATLRGPASSNGTPGIIAVSSLPGGFPIARLVEQFAEAGCVTLNTDLATDGPVEYPEVLDRLPAACTYLQHQVALDGQGIVLIGAGIGGDLALHAASTDSNVVGVVAIDPLLTQEATGLDHLRRSTFWEALQWGRTRRRLARTLASADHLAQMTPRRALFVYHTRPPTAAAEPAGADIAVVKTDDEAVERIVNWATELTT